MGLSLSLFFSFGLFSLYFALSFSFSFSFPLFLAFALCLAFVFVASFITTIRFGLFFAALMAVAANRWFLEQVQAFRPPPAPDDADEAPLPLIADRQAEGS